MLELEYEAGVTGERIGLDGPDLFVGYALDLHSSEWSYELGASALGSVARKAREGKLTLQSTSDEAVDAARRVFDRDVAKNQPGKLWYRNELFQRCFLTKAEASTVAGRFKTLDMTVTWLDGVWRKPVLYSFMPSDMKQSAFLDYDFDYPYDYGASSLAVSLNPTSLLDSGFQLIIYGQALSPAITIAGNNYQISNLTVPSGGYLTVDSLAKKITMTTQAGVTTNQFANGERSTGLGSGNYIFQPIPPGVQPASWDGGFGFDLTVFEEEAAPPWAQTPVSSSPVAAA